MTSSLISSRNALTKATEQNAKASPDFAAKLADTLCSGRLALLLLFKSRHGLRLCLAVALRQKVGNRGGLLVR